jgi:hypothetical protein
MIDPSFTVSQVSWVKIRLKKPLTAAGGTIAQEASSVWVMLNSGYIC